MSEWTSIELRLTDDGCRALEIGLDDPAEVPGFEVGGYIAYRRPVWGAAAVGDDWSIDVVSRSRTR